VFGERIGSLLWKEAFNEGAEVKETEFTKHYYELVDIQAEECIKMFESAEEFLDACLSTVGKELKSENQEFVSKLVEDAVTFYNFIISLEQRRLSSVLQLSLSRIGTAHYCSFN
jgi:hypothetical protein